MFLPIPSGKIFGGIIFKPKKMQISVFNVKGSLVGSYQRYGTFDYGKLPKGLYVVILQRQDGKKERHLVMV